MVTQGIWKADTSAIIGGRRQVLAERENIWLLSRGQSDADKSQPNEFQDTPLANCNLFPLFQDSRNQVNNLFSHSDLDTLFTDKGYQAKHLLQAENLNKDYFRISDEKGRRVQTQWLVHVV